MMHLAEMIIPLLILYNSIINLPGETEMRNKIGKFQGRYRQWIYFYYLVDHTLKTYSRLRQEEIEQYIEALFFL
jgi:hypothetical protein